MMDRIRRLRELITQVELVSGPCPKLDVSIADMLGWPDAPWTSAARPYTASCDAAASVIPKKFIRRTSQIRYGWLVELWEGDVSFNTEPFAAGLSEKEPLALLDAALHARLVIEERRAAALSDLAAQDGELLRDEGNAA